MNKVFHKLLLFVALVAGASCARAASITYTFTSAPGDVDEGTSFTYVSSAGFLAFDTGNLAPTTASHLFLLGTDYGVLTGFDFVSSSQMKFFSAGASLTTLLPSDAYQISALTPGERISGTGTLAITNTAGVTPEPSSLVLLGTGLLGAFGAARRRWSIA